MTPEERREEHMSALYNSETQGPTAHYSALLAYLDEHQPLTAKLLREGDPEGPVADAIRYGMKKAGSGAFDEDGVFVDAGTIDEYSTPWRKLEELPRATTYVINYPEGHE